MSQLHMIDINPNLSCKISYTSTYKQPDQFYEKETWIIQTLEIITKERENKGTNLIEIQGKSLNKLQSTSLIAK